MCARAFSIGLGRAAVLVLACSILARNVTAQIEIGGGRIQVIAEGGGAVPDSVMTWVRNAAHAVTEYYGRFPAGRLTVRVRLTDGARIGNGRTFGTPDGGLIKVSVGRDTTDASFHEDWLMTHEMVHLAFPSVADRHHWIEEGTATYVEPVARVRVGNLTAEDGWVDLVRGLPQGLPETGDRGLDFTPTWGRTYWGGALFCFLADVEIHRRTANKKGLIDAGRAVLDAGGSLWADWEIARALEVGDRATGVPVLKELYEKMRANPYPVDLEKMWQDLGIERSGRGLRFNDRAPLAEVRRAIMNTSEKTGRAPNR